MCVLVIGGAGYIGAHLVRALGRRGDRVVVVDDLSSGRSQRIQGTETIVLDVSDERNCPRLARVMRDHAVTAVVHFAAKKEVFESVRRPSWYFRQNIGGLLNVLSAMQQAAVRKIVFSSSAAVYGSAPSGLVAEESATLPINPYGETKLIGEWLMADNERAWKLDWIALRYFNVAGAGWDDLGDRGGENLLSKVFGRLEAGELPIIFGSDYPTQDGTCVRDFIHVSDLATAHIAALDHLRQITGRTFRVFNVGTGVGTSVRQIVDLVRTASGIDFEPTISGRRAGDPAYVVGDVSRIREHLSWAPVFGVEDMVNSAWRAWQFRGDESGGESHLA